MAENPTAPCTLKALKKLIPKWMHSWSTTEAPRVVRLGQILAAPDRFVRFMQAGGIIARPVLILDKTTGEVIEHKTRCVRLLNTLSAHGVDFCRIDDDADAWLRTLCSGRKLTSSGAIE